MGFPPRPSPPLFLASPLSWTLLILPQHKAAGSPVMATASPASLPTKTLHLNRTDGRSLPVHRGFLYIARFCTLRGRPGRHPHMPVRILVGVHMVCFHWDSALS